MELSQLNYFLTVANCGQIAQAASVLYMSQSAISMSISRLEKELGIKLFERKGRSIILTRNGKLFLDMITPALAELDFAKRQIMAAQQREPDVLTLSVEAPDFATNFERLYRQKHPDVRFRQAMDTTEATRRKLMCKTVDFAITFEPVSAPEIQFQQLLSEPVLVQLPAQHPLAQRDGIWLSELSEMPFVSFSAEYSFRRWNDAMCFMAGFQPNIYFEVCDTQSLMSLVHSGNAAAFIGQSTWESNIHTADYPTINDGYIRAVPLLDKHCTRNMYLCSNKSRLLPPAAKDFKTFATLFYAAINQHGNWKAAAEQLQGSQPQ